MTDTVVVCATVLLVVLIATASYLYLAVTERASRVSREDVLLARLETAVTAAQDVSDRLQNAPLAAAVSAHSERIALMETALKSSIAQMVNASGYTEEKYKQLIAAQVRGQGAKRPGAPA